MDSDDSRYGLQAVEKLVMRVADLLKFLNVMPHHSNDNKEETSKCYKPYDPFFFTNSSNT
jgi:hypothetical protein